MGKMKFTSIALSGVPGAGKTTLMGRLSKRLGWEIYYIGGEFDRRYKIWLANNPDLGRVDFGEWWNSYVPKEDIEEINEMGRGILRMGERILDSRYAMVNALGVPTCLVVGVQAPLHVRAARAEGNPRYDRCKTFEERAAAIDKRENFEVRRGEEIYGHLFGGNFDYREPKHYHLLLNSAELSIEEEEEIVLRRLAA